MISSKKSVVKETNAKVYSKPVLSQKLLSQRRYPAKSCLPFDFSLKYCGFFEVVMFKTIAIKIL